MRRNMKQNSVKLFRRETKRTGLSLDPSWAEDCERKMGKISFDKGDKEPPSPLSSVSGVKPKSSLSSRRGSLSSRQPRQPGSQKKAVNFGAD